jgi:hypothetical protein
MRKIIPLVLSILMIVYLPIVLMTSYSLTGFWTDPIFAVALAVVACLKAFRKNTWKRRQTYMVRAIAVVYTVALLALGALFFPNMFSGGKFKTRSFMFLFVNGRLYHAYFEPKKTYYERYGNVWVTESPLYFPVIEKWIHDKHGVQYDFGHDTFYGKPIDNHEVMRYYIDNNRLIK